MLNLKSTINFCVDVFWEIVRFSLYGINFNDLRVIYAVFIF